MRGASASARLTCRLARLDRRFFLFVDSLKFCCPKSLVPHHLWREQYKKKEHEKTRSSRRDGEEIRGRKRKWCMQETTGNQKPVSSCRMPVLESSFV